MERNGAGSIASEEIRELTEGGVLSEKDIARISEEHSIPVSRAGSIHSFYIQDQSGDRICVGLPCRLASKERLDGLPEGGTASCLGYCDHAPVIRKDGRYFSAGGTTPVLIEESTEKYVQQNMDGIEEYMLNGGYEALDELIVADDLSYVERRVRESGLRGMGGAGFPAHAKWKSFGENRVNDSYLLINGHEGEPGTFKDRAIMELMPHTLLEGALIAALSNSIHHVLFAVKSEYRNALMSLRKSVEELSVKFGSERISNLLPEISITSVSGTYVTGEETALMEAVEGKRSEPRLRPPFPTEKGLYGKPTMVHNVETLSLLPSILRNGSSGLKKSYCLTGDVNHPGLVRSELGIKATELVYRHGRTRPVTLKAFMPGGLSGGILPGLSMDIRLEPEEVRSRNAGLGTGAFIAISESRCMVDISRSVNSFFERESCGKCAPCRLGTRELSLILDALAGGKGTMEDMERGKEVATTMINGSICALGQAAGKMFLDSVKYFPDEFGEHINGTCGKGVCQQGGD